MSVIVMGMEMPRALGLNVTIYPDGRVVEYLGSSGKRIVGTAVPLPEKHGRLIDADTAYDRIMEQEGGNLVDMDCVGMGLEECETIVETEGE